MSNDDGKGWIKLYRKSMDNHMYFEEPFTRWQAWVDLLLLATRQPRQFRIRGNKVELNVGDVAMAQKRLAGRWQWGNKKVIRFLDELEANEMIDIHHTSEAKEAAIKTATEHNTTAINIISIRNYGNYQLDNTTDNTTDNTADNTTDNTTYKNVKNVKNEKEKKENIKRKFSPPSTADVEAYCRERRNAVDAVAFVAFYESKGWVVGKSPMKDWRAAVRTWERHDGRTNTPQRGAVPGGVRLGAGEWITPDGRRTYGDGTINVPMTASPRPNERCCWSSGYNDWIM